MSVAFLQLAKEDLIRRYGKITETGVDRLLRQAEDGFKVDKTERAWLKDLVQADVFDTAAAKQRLVDAVARFPALPDFSGQVSGLVEGEFPTHMNDDELYLVVDGKAEWDSGQRPFSRSYLPIYQGPLRARLGSQVPASSAQSAAERRSAQARSPGDALRAAGRAAGVELPDLDALFHSPRFYNPEAQTWEGSCHAWTPLSQHARLSAAVDVEGPEGMRGLWYRGEFLSRADLGNLVMALGDTITTHPDAREMGDNFVNALDVLKAAHQYIGNRREGFQADVWNDVHRGAAQVWNQPFTKATLTSTTLDGEGAQAILRLAADDFAISDKTSINEGRAQVKQVALQATYGKEVADDHEGPPATEETLWNFYVVTDEDGKALNAYHAADPRLAKLPLPTHTSAELPDFIVKPDLGFVDDAFAGRENPLIDRDPNGAAFRFLLSEVLAKGSSAAAVTAFERAVLVSGTSPIVGEALQALKRDHPNIGLAYTEASWARAFAGRGLRREDFGG